MKRALEFDGIRAAAILFILLCHICFGMGWSATGRFCANTFNTVFFLLSALLLGLNVNKYKLGGGGGGGERECFFFFFETGNTIVMLIMAYADSFCSGILSHWH